MSRRTSFDVPDDEYILFDGEHKLAAAMDNEPLSPTCKFATETAQRWWLVLPIILLGVGAHATNQAMAPAQPALEALGLSPIGFALVTIAPHLGQMLLPAAWAVAFARRPRFIVVVAPALLLISAICMVAGLALNKFNPTYSVGSFAAISLGFMFYVLGNSGLTVLQHSLIATTLPASLILGFCLTLASTRLTGAAVLWGVPQLLDTYGLLIVQSALLLVSSVGLACGLFLSMWLPLMKGTPTPSPSANRRQTPKAFVLSCSVCGALIPQDSPYATKYTQCSSCKKKSAIGAYTTWRIVLLSGWKATTLGTLHG